jgi:hypothetical protein
LFARVLLVREVVEVGNFSIPSFGAVPVSQHARHCKPQLVQVNGPVQFKATSVQWRTPREFCWPDTPSVTDVQQFSYSGQSLSAGARRYE